jgi:hypothetical protein
MRDIPYIAGSCQAQVILPVTNLYSGDIAKWLYYYIEIIIVTMLGLNLTSKNRFSLNPVCTGSRGIVHKLMYVR